MQGTHAALPEAHEEAPGRTHLIQICQQTKQEPAQQSATNLMMSQKS